MRTLLLLGWLTLPIVGAAYHFGPGQDRLALDEASSALAAAEGAGREHDWAVAVEHLDAALKALPHDQVATARRARLERAKALMFLEKLSTAEQELGQLVTEIRDDPRADPGLARAAREALANAQFYMTWLMRLEGQPRTVWEPEIEAARQGYRLLAEEAVAAGDAAAAERGREDVEAAVRLARLDVKDLQGLPLPSQ